MGTYLEDYLESMYMLPSEVKRNFDLMRELDKTSYPLIDELQSFHKEYLTSARRKVVERCNNAALGDPDEAELRALVETDPALEKLREKHQRVVQKLDEKIAIAAQSYDIVDHHIRRLDQDLEAYAALLKQNGEFEDDKAASKKRKLAQAAMGDAASTLKLDSASSKQAAAELAVEEKKQKVAGGFTGSGVASGSLALERSTSLSSSQTSRKSGAAGAGSGRKRAAAAAAAAAAAEHVEVVLTPAAIPIGAEDLPIDPNEPVYCNCRRVSFGQMVGCDNDDCKYEWFHFECVGLTDQPQGKWYCPDCKSMLGIK